MEPQEFLRSRGKALEESFFAHHNEKLRQQLRERAKEQAAKDALREVSGITDEGVLDELIAHGVNVDRVAALTLVPLVLVAWADGAIQPKEREAIIKAAAAKGIERGSLPCQLLENYLENRPDDSILGIWEEYIGTLAKGLPPEQRKTLKHDLLDRARDVAEAAGGFLGLASISKEEQAMLEELESTFA